ncbi:DNA double-strand break repair nuclease NurA, partial [Chloroflexota bacterium]
MNETTGSYAHLPDELLSKILEHVPKTVDKMNSMFHIQDEPIQSGYAKLKGTGAIKKISETHFISSLIAVDGSWVLDRLTGSDLLLAVALGVEGLSEDKTKEWGVENNQYYQWQTVLPHNEANSRLAQGVMFLMELSVLASSKHDIRLMDGTHFTPILKVNSMLSAREDKAGDEYASALRTFLSETYAKIIPDIPDIVRAALTNDKVIALAKYSSSRDVIDTFLSDCNITVDDKTFFSLSLGEDEYLAPMSVGQSKQEREKIWDDLHIICNLEIPEKDELNLQLRSAISPLTTKAGQSELFFTYFKPYQEGPAYRIEIKKTLAEDVSRLEQSLLGIKEQIVYPQIREPYPQYLADVMAKSISTGMFAIKEAIRLSPD